MPVKKGCEAERAFRPGDMARQCVTVGDTGLYECTGQGDALAVLVERHQDGHVRAGSADAELHAIGKPVQELRGIQGAD